MSRLPNLSAQQLLKALERAGFQRRNQRGSHLRLVHPTIAIKIIVPIHPGDLSRPLLKKIVKQAGLTEDQFRELL
jgi:predicted RNA binding protein YcfA (HicA-like mRNA interferase family)